MLKAQKHDLVKQLSQELKGAKTTVLVDYTGLTVKLQQDLAKRLKEVGASIMVVKNTLLKLAGKEAKLSSETLSEDILSGQTALVIGHEDPISPLQILGKFVSEFELPKFKVGIVEGNFYDNQSLVALSKLPGKDVLEAQVVGTIAGSMYGLIGVLQGNLQKLVYILSAKGGDNK